MSKQIQEETIQQFFKTIGFTPPKNKDIFDFIDLENNYQNGFDSNSNQDSENQTPGIPDNITDVLKNSNNDDHPDPCIYADFYAFNDPGSRNEPDLNPPKSYQADKLNKNYTKKDLRKTHSFSDTHLESINQPASEFPRHTGVASIAVDQEYVLQKPTLIEGIIYPKNTILKIKSMSTKSSRIK